MEIYFTFLYTLKEIAASNKRKFVESQFLKLL